MRTVIRLVWMCTLPQVATNSIVEVMNMMNKVLRSCILKIMMSFLYDILTKGCVVEEKDETMDDQGCHTFVANHIRDHEMVLGNLEDVHLMFFGKTSMFGLEEILVVGHLCRP